MALELSQAKKLVLLAGFVIAVVSGQSAGVSGEVVDGSGAPLVGAQIEISGPAGRILRSTTEPQGHFEAAGVEPGLYRFVIRHDGFEPLRQTVEVPSTGVVSLRFVLKVAATTETIVVTGTRDQVEISKSPVAVNVVTRSEIAVRNVRLPDQTLNYAEGVNVFRSKGAADSGAGVGMRGFSGRSQSRVLVLLDGQPVNDAYTGGVSWAALPVTELERVEVVRGPSSSLYGGNAMGGVIQMFTRPITQRVIEASGQYGSYGTMMYSGRYSDRFWQKLGVTLSYQRLQSDGYSVSGIYSTASPVTSAGTPLVAAPPRLLTTTGGVRYTIGEQGNNWYNQHAVRGKADYTLSSNTTATFQFVQPRYRYGYDSSTPTVTGPGGNPIASGNFFFYDQGLKRITLSPTLFVAGPGGNVRDVYTGSILHTFTPRSWLRVAGGSSNSSDDWYSLPSGSATFLGGPGTSTETPNRSSHADVQWNWSRSARVRYVFGSEARQDKAQTFDYNLADFAFRETRTALTKTSSGLALSTAVYAQADITLTEHLSLVAGGRFDHWRTYSGRSQSGPGEPLRVYDNRSADAMTGKVALAWEAPHDWTLRASVGNAFRAPTLINLYRTSSYPPGTITEANPTLQPERMTSWEVGLRKRLGSRFSADATYFENYVKNLIYTTTDLVLDPTGATRRNVNAGRGRTRGAEIAFRQRLTGWLQLSESYTLNDARITRNDYLPASVGRYVPYVPRTVATFSSMLGRGRWSGSLSGKYSSRTFNSDTNNDVVKGVPGSWDPYFEMEATGGFRVNRSVSLFVSANNLLNRRYYEYYLVPGRTLSGGILIRLSGKDAQ